jgi:hypothetical protein
VLLEELPVVVEEGCWVGRERERGIVSNVVLITSGEIRNTKSKVF